MENQNLTIATSTDSTSSLQADQFADWKTYTNSQYGFVFKYPNDWTINTSEKSVSLNSPERIKLMDVEVPDNFDFSVIEKSSSQDVVSFSNSIDNGWFTHYKSQISLKVDDRSAIKFDDISDSVPSQPPIAVLVDAGAYSVLLRDNGSLSENGKILEKNPIDIFDGILSTFKFTK